MATKGSNKAKCKHYRDINSRVVNKTKKLNKHLKKFPQDLDAQKALEGLK